MCCGDSRTLPASGRARSVQAQPAFCAMVGGVPDGCAVAALQGLGLDAFTPEFDRHLMVWSKYARDVIAGGPTPFGARVEENAAFTQMLSRPECWGIKSRMLRKFWTYIEDDLLSYSAAHGIDEERNHVCYVEPCGWRHTVACAIQSGHAVGSVSQMVPNMHLVVQRYIKPWTLGHNVGMALMLNAAVCASISDGRPVEELCAAEVFISHSWSEEFSEFVSTLWRFLRTEATAWVCSFALDQNGDIAASLSDLASCPFARAMAAIPEVVVVTDRSAEALQRCWVVLEAELAHSSGKRYTITVNDNSNVKLWEEVWSKIGSLDVRECKASYARDKDAILQYVEHGMGVDRLNAVVREVALSAFQRAAILAVGMTGDISRLPPAQELLEWRSLRGKTLVHVCAKSSKIAALAEVLRRTNFQLLNAQDQYGFTPLSSAAEGGCTSSAQALISLRADIEIPDVDGFRPLHHASMAGAFEVVRLLLQVRADIEAPTSFSGGGFRPLSLAAFAGHPRLLHLLASQGADLTAATGSGAGAIGVAARHGHAEAVAVLLAIRGQPDMPNARWPGRTPLVQAAERGHISVVGLLVGARACARSARRHWRFIHDFSRRELHKSHSIRVLLGGSPRDDSEDSDGGFSACTPVLARRGLPRRLAGWPSMSALAPGCCSGCPLQ